MSDLMPLSLVAQALAVSLRTVSRMARAGQLPIVKMGRIRRVRQADLERFISRRLQYFGSGVVKPFFFRSSVLEDYKNSREYYLRPDEPARMIRSGGRPFGRVHESGFHGRLRVSESEVFPFWKVPVTQEFIVIRPKDFNKLPRAVQEHWRKYLILNQDIEMP